MSLPENWLELLKAAYPRREGAQGWAHLKRLIPRAIAGGASWSRILAGTHEYRRHIERSGKVGTEMVKQAQTFFGPGEWWEEYADIGIQRRAKALEHRALSLGFSSVAAELLADPDALEAKLNAKEREIAERRARSVNVADITQRMRA